MPGILLIIVGNWNELEKIYKLKDGKREKEIFVHKVIPSDI